MLKIKTNDTPEWNSMFLISVFEAINIQTFFLLLPSRIQSELGINNQVLVFAIVPGIILFVINYFLYVKNVQKITSIYEYESQKKKLLGVIGLLIYSIGTFVFFFLVFNLRP